MDKEKIDDLLHAWIEMSMGIRGNRLVNGLSFNEMVVCHYLYDHQKSKSTPMTATDLTCRMHLLKSQMNRLLTGLEEKNMITRERNIQDKRKVQVVLNKENLEVYEKEHGSIMQILNLVSESLGEEKTVELAKLLHEATKIIDTMEG